MATITKPIALDESFKTNESTSRNIADVLAEELSNIAQSIGAINQKYKIVQTLPDTDISTTAIYLVPKSTAQTDNTYDEYINLTGTSLGWEKIGDTEIDLSDYYTESEVDALLAEKADVSDIPVLPTTDEQTSTTGEFETVTGGLLGECIVSIEPVQDLNGYDHPWVGGAGKNKFKTTLTSQTINGVQFTVNDDGTFLLNGSATTYAYVTLGTIQLTGGTSYIISPTINLNDSYYYYIPTDSFAVRGTARTYTPSETKEVTFQFVFPSNAVFDNSLQKPMIRLATESDATFEPYSNICPISGHTQADVEVVGKNRFNPSTITLNTIINNDGSLSSNNFINTSDYIIINAQAFTVLNNSTANDVYIRAGMYDENYNFIRREASPVMSSQGSYTFSNVTGIKYVRISYEKSSNNELQLELGNTATTFESYKGKTYSTLFGSTYYGGTIDLVSGVLTVTHGYIEYDGSSDENWSVGGTGTGQYKYMTMGSPNTLASTNIYCNEFVPTQIYTSNQNIGIYTSTNQVRVRPDFELTDATAWKTWLSSHPIQLAYELATPTTIQLTPQQVISLVGKNYVDAPLDGQTIVEVKFKQLMTIDDVLALIGG